MQESMTTTDYRSLQATFVPRSDAPGHGRLYFWCMPPRHVEFARKALQSLGILRRGKTPPLGPVQLAIPTPTRNKTEEWEIAELRGIRLPMVETVRGLVRLDLNEARRRRVSDSVRVWAMAAKLAVELVAAQEVVPLLVFDEHGKAHSRWGIANASAETRDRIHKLAAALPIAGHSLILDAGQKHEQARARRKNRRRRKRRVVTPDTTIWSAEGLIQAFLDAVADAMCREAMPSSSRDRPRKDNRALAPWELRWRYALTAADSTFEYAGLVEQPLFEQNQRWVSAVRPEMLGGTPYSVAYQLELPGTTEETDDVPGAWYLRFLLQANDDPSVVIDAAEIWQDPSRVQTRGERTFVRPHESLLQSLAETSRLFDPVRRALRSPQPQGVVLSTEEAWQFLSTVAPILAQFGVAVLVPRALRSDGQQRLRLNLHVGSEGESWGDRAPSKVGIRGLTDFRWQVALGDVNLTPEEFREIAAMQQPLVQWRGQWMAVDPQELGQMEALFDNAQTSGEIDRTTALAAALTGSVTGVGGSGQIEVVAEGEIADLVGNLRNTESFEELPTPEGFVGELRPYQTRGLTWMANMCELGFGVCLADDMGLGKTIQVIATLLHHAEEGTWGDTPALLVCPTSVLGNWERELKRFAPGINVVRHHGRGRDSDLKSLNKQAKGPTVVLTTYVIARMDVDMLSKQSWSHLIIDEAQNIKNPQAQQAVAIRKIPAMRRIALTGTPIENRLMELWSILEFANPGLLGSARDFRRRFALPVERFGDRKAAETLRRMVGPFILRRLKSDPNIIQDLPEKQEYRVYCMLTREQATLYQAAVDAALEKIEGSSGVKRRGNILALLTSLKQICNHPVHYLKEEDAKLSSRSGKLTRLMEMMEEVIAEGDHALIFTQYTEMGHLLVDHFRDRLDLDLPFIHGGVSARERDRIVDEFQTDPDAPPALLLSLKAGGTGLNLTRATHVFHFDRWWNPAVEDQATDRAFRLGQTRQVQVHKMVCTGTVEEKIDEILESKRDLAESVVGAGEEWITELGDSELRELFSLTSNITIDDDVEARG